ncbi:MAG: UDP-N-acetylglucosamine--N-acetylmuramyl-(pentapeptide) pyrophosphoryl-undecaprenol N-acetylglucosamine transferase [Candidatus Pacebacteria bacterium]|nr:UDP-N-acetylglucosamine--N-acetylmuramyl-(pentapeptide) pyrophosphoryl-undecaprenol N-acetylglucosamine transferase [Candidatus Paceibacterota bacterium]MBP9867180.1 UDP-N-acetylglucosamine--N-acetylmuramyl-(pentapeptide) pyrophosphoryl-undecaprenol N-acetylglucosamine transferase [Candidatus Paceibacterota bacterium]
MKIVITGAGGGHFYPLIAVVESIRKQVFIQKIVQPEVFFFSDKPYDEKLLFEQQISFIEIPAGKLRVYSSFETITDFFKTIQGCIVALFKLYSVYPDVVFAKGGYASFPTLVAARILSIPVVVHESDTIPGRTTVFGGNFAARIALSYPEAAPFFPKEKIALTGQPIRDSILPKDGYIREYGKRERPAIMILCGSQGSQRVNEMILRILPELLTKYDVVHQVGTLNLEEMKKITSELLHGHEFKNHYFVDGFIDVSLFYPKVDLLITRGSSAMFEAAIWQLPMIVIPIPETISRDQCSNAYAMAGRGVASVLEENNIGNTVILSEISRILEDEELYTKMSKSGLKFESSRDASNVIGRELVRICLSHSS